MRIFSTWLLVFCVLAGLNARVLATQAHRDCAGEAVELCCSGHPENPAPASHEHDGKSCPLDHHHHGCCSHVLPLTVDHTAVCRLGFPGLSLSGVRPECEVAPEGPFLGLEKPPLI